MTFDTILIANRGEIAARVMRTAKSLGLKTIAVYSETDKDAPHVQIADDAVLIGPGPVGESYLCMDKILDAAKQSGAQAIHPGYGFLSENDAFAKAVEEAGLIFVGPPADAIRQMGNKAEAKRLMIAAGVPCVPGYDGKEQDDALFIKAAAEAGYPIMVKAAAGGGGRGMRFVDTPEALPEALTLARSEAENAFGSGELIIEKAILQPRHVEVQVVADGHGACIHLGERDCSVQRRHQKVIEEAPCPVMTGALRAEMGAAAVAAAQAVNYRGVGTVEFLLDANGGFYFLEMNTRLQVEHPVTEEITGLDLVALQIAVAQGNKLPLAQEDVMLTGHAIEVRLYAEDPANDFLPATGKIELWRPAEGEGVRVDAGIVTGQEVSPFYDPMLAKVIAYGDTREVARLRLVKALEQSVLLGPIGNTSFLTDALCKEAFVKGEATTAFIGENYPDGVSGDTPEAEDWAVAAAIALHKDMLKAYSLSASAITDQLGWASTNMLPCRIAFKDDSDHVELLAKPTGAVWTVTKDETEVVVELLQVEDNEARVTVNGKREEVVFEATANGPVFLARGAKRFSFPRYSPWSEDALAGGNGTIVAPMHGAVIDVVVKEGQAVKEGDTLAVLEAMKMQHQITADIDGTVSEIAVSAGEQVGAGDLMIQLKGSE